MGIDLYFTEESLIKCRHACYRGLRTHSGRKNRDVWYQLDRRREIVRLSKKLKNHKELMERLYLCTRCGRNTGEMIILQLSAYTSYSVCIEIPEEMSKSPRNRKLLFRKTYCGDCLATLELKDKKLKGVVIEKGRTFVLTACSMLCAQAMKEAIDKELNFKCSVSVGSL